MLTRMVVISVWACFVLVSAGLAASYYQLAAGPTGHDVVVQSTSGTETVKIRQVSVPMMRDGVLRGYVVARFSAIVSMQKMKHLRPSVEDLIVDEIIKEIFLTSSLDAPIGSKPNLSSFTAEISRKVNKRVATELVQDVLINEFAFIEKDQARR